MAKIDDQTFQIPLSWKKGDDMILEFYVCNTNEINPYRELKELGVVIYDKDEEVRKSDDFNQLDNMNEFGIEKIDELIKFIHKVKKHIKQFNENSEPIEQSE